jgi:hypothetical protein
MKNKKSKAPSAHALSATLVGDYYGKNIGQMLKDEGKVDFLMQKTKKSVYENACLFFMRAFLIKLFQPIFEGTNTKITLSIKTDYAPNELYFEVITHKDK